MSFDSSTGIFTFNTDATVKTSFEVEIDVVTSDGVNDDVLKVTGLIINTQCGPTSTTITTDVKDKSFASEDYQSYESLPIQYEEKGEDGSTYYGVAK
jgi:hypothetical protein